MEAIAVVVAAVVAAVGGIWLDRRFQEQDRLRDLYLETLEYLDNLAVTAKEHIVAGTAESNVTANELERQINTMNSKLSLIASDRVRKRFADYRKSWPRVAEAFEKDRPPGTNFSEEFTRAVRSLDPERDALVKTMRRDLKKGNWGRRKV